MPAMWPYFSIFEPNLAKFVCPSGNCGVYGGISSMIFYGVINRLRIAGAGRFVVVTGCWTDGCGP